MTVEQGGTGQEPRKATPKKVEAAPPTEESGTGRSKRVKKATAPAERRPQPKVTPENRSTIIDLARQNTPLADIVAATGVPESNITSLLGRERKKDPTIPMLITPEAKQEPLAVEREASHQAAVAREEEAHALQETGVGKDEIAERLGVSGRTVNRYLEAPGPSGRTRAEQDTRIREIWRLKRLHPDWNNGQIGREVGMGRSGVGKILAKPEPEPPRRAKKGAEPPKNN